MLLSVVSTKTATPCHQIQSRQVNLGRVICRSFHSTTPDLAKPSSQRRDLEGAEPKLACSASLFLFYAVTISLLQRNALASTHMRWRTVASLRASATFARFMPRRFATSIAQRFSVENLEARVSMICAAS